LARGLGGHVWRARRREGEWCVVGARALVQMIGVWSLELIASSAEQVVELSMNINREEAVLFLFR